MVKAEKRITMVWISAPTPQRLMVKGLFLSPWHYKNVFQSLGGWGLPLKGIMEPNVHLSLF